MRTFLWFYLKLSFPFRYLISLRYLLDWTRFFRFFKTANFFFIIIHFFSIYSLSIWHDVRDCLFNVSQNIWSILINMLQFYHIVLFKMTRKCLIIPYFITIWNEIIPQFFSFEFSNDVTVSFEFSWNNCKRRREV